MAKILDTAWSYILYNVLTFTGVIIRIKVVSMVASTDFKERFQIISRYAMITNFWTLSIIYKKKLLLT